MNDDKDHLIKAALALDPEIQMNLPVRPAARRVGSVLDALPYPRVTKVLVGYDRDGEPEYIEHHCLGDL